MRKEEIEFLKNQFEKARHELKGVTDDTSDYEAGAIDGKYALLSLLLKEFSIED